LIDDEKENLERIEVYVMKKLRPTRKGEGIVTRKL
jgi:hypothetical protein